MNRRSAVASLLAILLAACAGAFDAGRLPGTGQPPPECRANSYDFIGRGTFAGLGLDTATPVPPPDPDRIAMIWVTHDLLPYDRGEEGGPIEMTRMMCFQFADGTGGTDWPVAAAWQLPSRDSSLAVEEGSANPLPLTLLAALGLGAALLVAALAAFRRRSQRLNGAGNLDL